MVRYSDGFSAALDVIAADSDDACAKLQRYVDLFEAVLVLDRLCLCGMFAAEILTLPPALQDAVRAFFDRNESWLAEVLLAGRNAQTLEFRGTALDVARYIVGTLEGAMLLAYSYGDVARFRVAAEHLLSEMGTPAAVR
jgi:TetR/AcrR family transcriptional repressor of nem operon